MPASIFHLPVSIEIRSETSETAIEGFGELEMLTGAHARLRAGRTLEADQEIERSFAVVYDEAASEIDAAAGLGGTAPPRLGIDSCAVCGARESDCNNPRIRSFACEACDRVYYCSKRCRVQDRVAHAGVCDLLRDGTVPDSALDGDERGRAAIESCPAAFVGCGARDLTEAVDWSDLLPSRSVEEEEEEADEGAGKDKGMNTGAGPSTKDMISATALLSYPLSIAWALENWPIGGGTADRSAGGGGGSFGGGGEGAAAGGLAAVGKDQKEEPPLLILIIGAGPAETLDPRVWSHPALTAAAGRRLQLHFIGPGMDPALAATAADNSQEGPSGGKKMGEAAPPPLPPVELSFFPVPFEEYCAARKSGLASSSSSSSSSHPLSSRRQPHLAVLFNPGLTCTDYSWDAALRELRRVRGSDARAT